MGNVRTLRSKAKRNSLWLAADGKCVNCRRLLETGWHADHVTAYSKNPETNVHDMQALCAACNLTKGNMSLRQHQKEMDEICRDIVLGQLPNLKRIIAHVTPGGGKSLLPVILAQHLIRARIVDKLCWVVPRKSLQLQAEQSFVSGVSRGLLNHSMKIRRSTNEVRPSRDNDGYVTTYQALQHDGARINLDAFSRHRYALILDEPHHLPLDSAWARPVQELVNKSRITLFMTGTLERGNETEQIAFLDYSESENKSGWTPVLEHTADQRVILYTRQNALSEQAIIPLHVEYMNGCAKWMDQDNRQVSAESLADANKADASSALRVALETEYAEKLLRRFVEDWQEYRRSSPWSLALVVAPNIAVAKVYKKLIHRTLGVPATDIATSDDDDASAVIERFRAGEIQCLVTVGMAYEGLDVPTITHLAGLTRFRSKPWIEQMLARANRYNRSGGPWAEQVARIYVPDDPAMHEIVDALIEEQAPFVRRPKEGPVAPLRESAATFIVPLSSDVTGQRAQALGPGEMIGYEQTEAFRNAAKSAGLPATTVQLDRFLKALHDRHPPVAPPQTDGMDELTPSQMEEKYRDQISAHVLSYDSANKQPFGTLNRDLYKKFKQTRKRMTLTKLQSVLSYIREQYPI